MRAPLALTACAHLVRPFCRNSRMVARMLGTAAFERKEGRGGHFRLDRPAREDRYLGNFVLWSDGERVRSEFRPVPSMDDEAPVPIGVPPTMANPA